MDNHKFIQHISKAAGHDIQTTNKLSQVLTGLIASVLANCDTVAIPGFGNLTSSKTDEHINTMPDGRCMLMPPNISTKFCAGSRLRKCCAPHTSSAK